MKLTPLAVFVLASAFAPMASAATNTAPAEPDYAPCRVHQKSHAVFPVRLLEQGITQGEATIMLEIDTAGRVTDQLVTAYTHPEFAKEMQRTLAQWTFEPGRSRGQPVVSVMTATFEFTVKGVTVYERRFDAIRREDYVDREYAYAARSPDALDGKPLATTAPAPIYPKAWMDAGRRGTVTVQFYIDEEGRPRMPIVTSDSDSYLASAAAAAVREWRFQPPMAKGKPVLVQAEQVFVFEPKLANSS